MWVRISTRYLNVHAGNKGVEIRGRNCHTLGISEFSSPETRLWYIAERARVQMKREMI